MNWGNSNKKLTLKSVMLVITGLLILSCILMVIYAMRARRYNEKSIELSKLHMKYTEIASALNSGSHTLTEQARLFAETGDVAHLYNYFKEVNYVKRRDKAMDELEKISVPDNAREHIESSMNASIELMQREYYSMKLTAISYNIAKYKLPAEIQSVELSLEDRALTAEEMREKARIILFDDDYMEMKKLIAEGTTKFLDTMQEDSKYEYLRLTKKVSMYVNILWLTIMAVLILILSMTIFQYTFVVRPIVKASQSISRGERIEMPRFLKEMNSLCTSYNSLMDDNEKLVKKLWIIAETDALTKIGNRTAYNDYCKKLHKEGGETILFVFDVNGLRELNNSLGHNEGDKLLRRAAECIVSVFEKDGEENCFRIGGDEFVAFIRGEAEENAEKYVEEFKNEQENKNVKIAVGFKYTEDIKNTSIHEMFVEADKMMYIDKAETKA